MRKLNHLEVLKFNNFSQSVYNQFPRSLPKAYFQRLPGARPVILSQEREPIAVLENAEGVIATREIGTGGENTLIFHLPFNDPKNKYLENENRVQLVENEYIIRQVTHDATNGFPVTEVYCEAAWYDLQYADPLEINSWSNVEPKQVMEDLLDQTEWKVGRVEISRTRNLELDSKLSNRLEGLWEVSEVWGGELEFDTRNYQVHLVEQVGVDSGVAIIYGKNMKHMEAVYNTEDLVTRLYPYGKNRISIENANDGVPYIDNFQYTQTVRVKSFKDDRFNNPYHLKEKAEEILKQLSIPRSTYLIKAADFSKMAELSHESFQLGDIIRVYNKELGIEVKTRIKRMEYDVLEPWNTTLELSQKEPGLSDLLADISTTTNHLQTEETVERQDLLNLMVFNYLLNSRADDGFAYWVNNGWEIDHEHGVSGPASFKVNGDFHVSKSLSQRVYPANRDDYTISFQASTENIEAGNNAKIGVEIEVEYEDGTTDVQFLPLV
ncbi:phage tail spike protein [Evansella halocellulosilytica]|uniref:phage tail spike protein n=1 Tax=Evansella halocellulosilytica TaxID=2011013 RepID=UPI000BB6DCE7|nr:phage tail protein [Evansella halocellulosilytica]